MFSDPRRLQDLKDFLQETVGLVKPALVLVTGDLTHAKFPDEVASQQMEEEWRMYAEALNSSVLDQVPWLDFRGNHGMPVYLDASCMVISCSALCAVHELICVTNQKFL